MLFLISELDVGPKQTTQRPENKVQQVLNNAEFAEIEIDVEEIDHGAGQDAPAKCIEQVEPAFLKPLLFPVVQEFSLFTFQVFVHLPHLGSFDDPGKKAGEKALDIDSIRFFAYIDFSLIAAKCLNDGFGAFFGRNAIGLGIIHHIGFGSISHQGIDRNLGLYKAGCSNGHSNALVFQLGSEAVEKTMQCMLAGCIARAIGGAEFTGKAGNHRQMTAALFQHVG